MEKQVFADRLIIITGEQSHDAVGRSRSLRAHAADAASCRNGVGCGAWIKLDGFSETSICWILAHETAAK